MQNSTWSFREENRKKMLYKEKNWSVIYRLCDYFITKCMLPKEILRNLKPIQGKKFYKFWSKIIDIACIDGM